MKIAYIFADLCNGGSEEYAFCLADSAKKSGNGAIFVSSNITKDAKDKLANMDIKNIHIDMQSSFNPVSVISAALKLKKITKNNAIDIVHANMLREHSIAVISKMLGAKFKIVRTFHRFDQFNSKMRPLMSIYNKFTDQFISISDQMTQYLQKNGIKNVKLVDNGVAKVDSINHENAIGFMGRLAKEKGIKQFVLENIESLKINKLVIAGDGPEFDEISDIVKSNNLNVQMMGRVTDKRAFFDKISALILPSETEVTPLVVLEAYSCGLPVVVFDIKQIKGLVRPENGAVVRYGDFKGLYEAAIKLSKNSNNYREANIKLYTEKYSFDKMWNATCSIYCDLIQNQ